MSNLFALLLVYIWYSPVVNFQNISKLIFIGILKSVIYK